MLLEKESPCVSFREEVVVFGQEEGMELVGESALVTHPEGGGQESSEPVSARSGRCSQQCGESWFEAASSISCTLFSPTPPQPLSLQEKEEPKNHDQVEQESEAVEEKEKEEEEEEEEEFPDVSFFRIFKLTARDLWDWWLILIGALGAFINGCSFPFFSIVFGEVLRVFALPADEVLGETHPWGAAFLGLGVVAAVGIFLQVQISGLAGWLGGWVGERWERVHALWCVDGSW